MFKYTVVYALCCIVIRQIFTGQSYKYDKYVRLKNSHEINDKIKHNVLYVPSPLDNDNLLSSLNDKNNKYECDKVNNGYIYCHYKNNKHYNSISNHINDCMQGFEKCKCIS